MDFNSMLKKQIYKNVKKSKIKKSDLLRELDGFETFGVSFTYENGCLESDLFEFDYEPLYMRIQESDEGIYVYLVNLDERVVDEEPLFSFEKEDLMDEISTYLDLRDISKTKKKPLIKRKKQLKKTTSKSSIKKTYNWDVHFFPDEFDLGPSSLVMRTNEECLIRSGSDSFVCNPGYLIAWDFMDNARKQFEEDKDWYSCSFEDLRFEEITAADESFTFSFPISLTRDVAHHYKEVPLGNDNFIFNDYFVPSVLVPYTCVDEEGDTISGYAEFYLENLQFNPSYELCENMKEI